MTDCGLGGRGSIPDWRVTLTSTPHVRLHGVVLMHRGNLTFYLVELRTVRTGATVTSSARLSLSLGRERATLGRYERGSSTTTPPCCQAGINVHGVQNRAAGQGLAHTSWSHAHFPSQHTAKRRYLWREVSVLWLWKQLHLNQWSIRRVTNAYWQKSLTSQDYLTAYVNWQLINEVNKQTTIYPMSRWSADFPVE